ncbi:hypothetical protein HDV03_001912 [Kappamyces sp. JEL0829]|nr:hypothetical protein HDV03_001912 [Kappamyces sp. JEL0829]
MHISPLFVPLLSFASAAAPASSVITFPAAGKAWLGAWMWREDEQKPVDFEKKFGYHLGAVSMIESLVPGMPNGTASTADLDALGTDALYYMSVYLDSPEKLTDAEIITVTKRCAEISNSGRRLAVRLGPEMNGDWFDYGRQPTLFLDFWKRFHAQLKAVAPNVLMVWSPNGGNNYPWGMTALNPTDLKLLDTNHNGVLDAGDDPYSPYWPGDDLVDVVALSACKSGGLTVDWFGTSSPYRDNAIPAPGFFEFQINVGGFYQTYAVKKNKPMFISETGSTWHPNSPPGPGELAIKQSWWRSNMFNASFLDTYSHIKLFTQFEIEKFEDDQRNWRVVTGSANILAAFKADFELVKDRFVMATPIASTSTSNPTGSSTGANGLVCSEKIGASVVFYSFPSQAKRQKEAMLKKLVEQTETLSRQISDLDSQLELERAKRNCGDVDAEAARTAVLRDLEHEQARCTELEAAINQLSGGWDSEKLERLQRETKMAREASNRWTDNVFNIQSWLRNNYNMDSSEFSRQFKGIVPDELENEF